MGKRARSSSSDSDESEVVSTVLPLSAEEQDEAKRYEEIARRAEERAAARAAAKANDVPANEMVEKQVDSVSNVLIEKEMKPSFKSKADREAAALLRLQAKRDDANKQGQNAELARKTFISGQAKKDREREEQRKRFQEESERRQRLEEDGKDEVERKSELRAIQESYLGKQDSDGNYYSEKSNRARGKNKLGNSSSSNNKGKIFKMEWDNVDDTGRDDFNPLYSQGFNIRPLFGRGVIGGIDERQQHQDSSSYLTSLAEKRHQELMTYEAYGDGSTGTGTGTGTANIQNRREQQLTKDQVMSMKMNQSQSQSQNKNTKMDAMGAHWTEKALDEMTERDWRIFREDYDIRILGLGQSQSQGEVNKSNNNSNSNSNSNNKGRKLENPLRYWNEAINLPESIMKAIDTLGYKDPNPIQRQAIPIGLACRDIIGIAETGSGKTCAFLVPLLSYIVHLPSSKTTRDSVAENGPLGIIMAPTRELAQQIDNEAKKLMLYTNYHSICIVGGQDIEQQGMNLRKGIHLVTGTPGRLVDCLASNYLVLNQCNYIILDEADRMVHMGFEQALTTVLDSMGGLIHKDNQKKKITSNNDNVNVNDDGYGTINLANVRVTAMFSATMSPEVERIAKRYLKQPAIIKIGDEDSGKNIRIDQQIIWITEGQKKSRLNDMLRRLNINENNHNHNDNDINNKKVIVFVNAKKQADVVGRNLEKENFAVAVLHGGKSQDVRESTLESFRNGQYNILVATDVAGRGLDIPDVSHVYNYDCPSKIEPYTHRIGRTGRAGKTGIAITFLTDNDVDIMYDLKNYLISTKSKIPEQLARHKSTKVGSGNAGIGDEMVID
jgi:ATP-dependent RNA helicase DDX23/PRP28